MGLGVTQPSTKAFTAGDSVHRVQFVGGVSGGLAGATSATVTTAAGTVSVTTSSAQFVAANTSRTFLVITNNSANDVSLSLGANAAVANQGIVLKANGGSWDGLLSGVLWRGEVRAIAGATSAVGYVEG